jgi:GNAT superfamily N-acetyltransferase/L-amino acid N-acyltransferase YncA
MDVRRIDPFDEELLARFHDACRRAELHERPWESIWSLAELRARFEHPSGTERSELFAAFDGADLVGAALVDSPLEDNTDKAWMHTMVPPEHRRRGVGTLLVEHLAEVVRTDGRSVLLAESSYPFEARDEHPYRRFAERNGFVHDMAEIVRMLQLPVPAEVLEDLAAEASPHHGAYRLETFVGVVPDEYLPTYCQVHNQLGVDAPTGDVEFEEESLTPEEFRASEQRFAAAGSTRVSTVAVCGDHEVVAYTDLVVKADPADRVQQWGTLVHRAHRGHRLGTAVKVANLRVLQERFPDRTEVVTSNAEVNQHMVDINDRLGFRAVAVLPCFRRVLAGADAR